jgi:cytoskeleton protein RodZ
MEAAASTTPDDGISAGKLLREAREAAGLQVSTLAANLKVPARKLEALEQDRYDQLGDAVFIRALASSVCRTLKVDPQPVLRRLPQTAQPRLIQDSEGINAPFRAPGDGPKPGLLDQVSRPVVLTVVALLLGALVLIFLPMVQRGYDTVVQANRQPEPVMPPPGAAANVPMAPVPVETPGTAAAPAAAAATVLTPASALAPAAPAAAVGAVPASPPAPVAATAPVTVAANTATPTAQAASGPIAARGIVLFRTRGPSWIQVTDASGATVMQRLMEPGETAGAGGRLPLSVTVGSVAATEVQVRGKPFNLGPVSRDNVARFEVK